MKINFKLLIPLSIVLGSLALVIVLGVFIRSSTLGSSTVLDYDPWWWYRHAKEIHENNFQIPKWDTLSYYPPGRPYQLNQGWPITIGILYEILIKIDSSITFMRAAILSPLIIVALIPIPAFLLGRLLSNNIGGILTALLAVTAPTFIGVSMAGYSDTDAPFVFYMFLSVLTVFLAIKMSKKKLLSIPFYALAVAVNLLFIFTWGAGWITLILFLAFIPSFTVFRLLEEMWHQKKLKIFWKELIPDMKSIFIPLIIIFLVTNIAGFFLGFKTMLHSLIGGLAFTGLGGEPLIVNISVAELQIINIFTKAGFFAVAGRVGLFPTILTLVGLPLLVIYKFFRKEKINFFEIFLYIWALATFYLILKGVRFSLFFFVPASIAAGYVIGNLFNYLRNKNILLLSTVFSLVGILTFVSVANAVQIGYASGGLAVSQNWYDALDWLKDNADKDALISTWWDPGHIIAGYTGLKVHADGAHCGYPSCSPYDHNTRIRDMGRLMSTNNESESIEIIKKYTHLTEEQCNEARKINGDKMSTDACKDVPEVYILASNDLIGKYFWMSCFGSFDMDLWQKTGGDKWKCDGKNFVQVPFTNVDRQGLPVYSQGGLTITLLQNGTDLYGVLNIPGQIRNKLVSDVVFYQSGISIHSKPNTNDTLDGMIWIDPSFRLIIFMDPSIRDSIFTRMFFFDGQGLENFDLMYSNSEVRIFKAKL